MTYVPRWTICGPADVLSAAVPAVSSTAAAAGPNMQARRRNQISTGHLPLQKPEKMFIAGAGSCKSPCDAVREMISSSETGMVRGKYYVFRSGTDGGGSGSVLCSQVLGVVPANARYESAGFCSAGASRFYKVHRPTPLSAGPVFLVPEYFLPFFPPVPERKGQGLDPLPQGGVGGCTLSGPGGGSRFLGVPCGGNNPGPLRSRISPPGDLFMELLAKRGEYNPVIWFRVIYMGLRLIRDVSVAL